MPKPLRSADPNPKSVQFSHFGVLDDGQRSKGAAVTSMVINGLILAAILILGTLVKTNPIMAKKLTELTLPPQPPPPPPVHHVPPPPPRPLPPTPHIVEPPKTVIPPPPEIKPLPVPVPRPVVTQPAPPKAVTPPPAPVVVHLGTQAAAIKNSDMKPSAVRLGMADNPLKPLSGPAVSRVDLGGAGMKGMNSSNTGSGPRAAAVTLGTGNPNGTNMNGRSRGSEQIAGVRLGVTGGTGPMGSRSNSPAVVHLGQQVPPPTATKPRVESLTASSPPKVVYKPRPVYTEEARELHLEGNVSVRIKVLASGAVEVLQVTHGLGHGLDQAAVKAVQETRFRPATDAEGRPVEWEGVVIVNFQMS